MIVAMESDMAVILFQNCTFKLTASPDMCMSG